MDDWKFLELLDHPFLHQPSIV